MAAGQPISDVNLLRLGLGAAVLCFGCGWMIAKTGWKALQQGRIALTAKKDLTGLPARICSLLFLGFGGIVLLDGIVILGIVAYVALKKFVL